MEAHELNEHAEHVHHAGDKGIGLTMAIVAVLLAIATLLSHRSHTEEVKLQGEINDQWGFYQAKHSRAYSFGIAAEMEASLTSLVPSLRATALKSLKKSAEEECGVPAEEHCASPIQKDSTLLQQLLEDEKAARSAGGHEANPEHAAKPAHAEGGAPGKPEKKEGAVKIQERAREMEVEKLLTQKRADFFDASELFLEISIVLCSIALLSGNKRFWHISFVSTIGGICVAAWGLLLH
ncbi:MAG TPA: DUF4337 domain-containing protein [Candidatus Saccharimonadales bacterium]|jgi:hypothetical protein|nr:DUF4337 domain-containing protein [Candidatus Saccharimonadales bacterium]